MIMNLVIEIEEKQLKTLKEAFQLLEEMAHDRGDDVEENLFEDIKSQIKSQMDIK